MMPAILAAALAIVAAPHDDVQPDGTIYYHFDYELMAKIHARYAEKRAAMQQWDYDPVTWLPVPKKSGPKEKPQPPRPYKRDDTAVRQARMQRAALRRQKSYQPSVDPLWWVLTPAVPT